MHDDRKSLLVSTQSSAKMQCEEEGTFIASCVVVQEHRGALTALTIAERWYFTRTIRTGDAALTPAVLPLENLTKTHFRVETTPVATTIMKQFNE